MRGTGSVRARFAVFLIALSASGPAAAVELDFGIAKTLEYLSLPARPPPMMWICIRKVVI